jgi:hypothetical protein
MPHGVLELAEIFSAIAAAIPSLTSLLNNFFPNDY